MAETKRCSGCSETKALSTFSVDRRSPDDLSIYCRVCKANKHREAKRRNPEAYRLIGRRARAKYSENHPERVWVAQLKHRYGLTPPELESMKVMQGFRCAFCYLDGELEIDHCHNTRAVRWLLCRKCNVGLGMFQEDPALMRRVADLLERRRG